MSLNTFGQRQKTGTAPFAVWAEVKGVKSGGGTIEGFSALPVGTVIPAGTPVYQDESGGTLKVLKTYRVAEDVSADTAVPVLTAWGVPAVDSFASVMSDVTGTVEGVKVTAVGADVNGVTELTVAEAVTLKEGDALIEVDKAGTGAVAKVVPNGLLWHDIVKEEGDTLATGAVVDVGRIFADRAPALGAGIEKHLVTIKFEKGIQYVEWN